MAKSVGIVRVVDPLGRVCIPKEMRSAYGLEHGMAVEIAADGNQIVLKPYDVAGRMAASLNELRELARLCSEQIPGGLADALMEHVEACEGLVLEVQKGCSNS